MSICISQILATLGSRQIVCRTLPRPTVCHDADGRMAIRPGNNAVVVRVRLAGDRRTYAMKCYTRPKQRLAAIYGERAICPRSCSCTTSRDTAAG